MKAKSTNKLVSLALALFMLLMSIPFSMLATTVRAEEASEADPNTHVFESKTMTTVDAGAYTDGQEVKYDDFFTIYMSSKTKIDGSSKTWKDDGYASDTRLNFGGAGVVTGTAKNVISFKTTAAATVKIWFVQGGDDNRQMAIWVPGANEPTAKTTLEGMKKNDPYYAELSLTEAGTYMLGGETNNNNIYKVEVEEAPAAAEDHVFESKTMTPVDAGAYTDGQEVKYDDFFTIYMSSKTKIDGSSKTWKDDGYASDTRLNFGGAGVVTGTAKNVISFKTTAAATVKIWFVQGGDDNRQMAIWVPGANEPTAKTTLEGMKKNDPYYAELSLAEAGTYMLGGETNNNNIYKVEVVFGGGKVVRGDWAKVEDPSIESVALNSKDKGKIDVTVNADVSDNGGDKVSVVMLDESGKEVDVMNSVVKAKTHTVTFAPSKSGKYTFTVKLLREGETDKVGKEGKSIDFSYPLGAPTITSATSKGKGTDGKGTVEVVWGPVDEATGYEVFVGETSKGKTDKTTFMITGLEIGETYNVTVKAIRGEEIGKASDAVAVKTTVEEQQTWGFMFYGTSTGKDKNTYSGDINKDGKVTVSATGNGGKFQEGSNDGLGFYYATIPSSLNFTLKATIHVNTWTYNSGQDGFGVMALDCLPGTYGGKANSTDLFWSNSYRVGGQRFAYYNDAEKGVNADGLGDKYSMNIGIGVQTKLGMTKDNIDDVYGKGHAGIVEFGQYTLETTALDKNLPAGTYHSVGNMTNKDQNTASAELTDFVLEIQRNNTGYFCTYYDKDGKTIIGQQKFYDPDALDQLDHDNVYVGFCTARNMVIEVSNVSLTTIDPKDDKPAEERPITKIDPTVTIGSSTIANSPEYTLLVKSNVVGKADIIIGGKTVKTVDLDGTSDFVKAVVTIAAGTNKIEVKFTPDKDQELPPYTQLSTTDPVTKTVNVKYETYFEKQNNLYVSPKGTKGGNGGKEYPLDIYTAVSVVRPGQTIVLMEGTYNLESCVTIERGISGTADKKIYMIADPEAKTRPVIDFGKKATVKTAGLLAVGDYWYFKGFDVTKTPDGTPGILVSGNNCTFDDIRTYANGDCGLYIRSKGNSADPKSLWPTNNLILNCTSYNNADGTGENADGFAAKFSVGVGNVFDGCVSYNNTDDGWDLYARGVSIEKVTLRNCVAYENGHNTDKSIKGNGNGFKLGGENMSAGHEIINSIAFNNDANGITSNSCPDIKVTNCISFDNGSANVALYTGNSKLDTNFVVDGLISFRSSGEDTPAAASADVVTAGAAGENDNIKPQGKQTRESLNGANNFFFADGATKSVAADGSIKEIKADMFESLEFSGEVKRADNGMVDLGGFLALKEDKVEAAFGKDFAEAMSKRFVSLDGDYKTESNTAGTSQDVTVTPDTELPPPTGFEVTIVVAVLAISAAVAIILIRKRKRNR